MLFGCVVQAADISLLDSPARPPEDPTRLRRPINAIPYQTKRNKRNGLVKNGSGGGDRCACEDISGFAIALNVYVFNLGRSQESLVTIEHHPLSII